MDTTFDASVSSVLDLTHDVRRLDLRLVDPPAMTFRPGQFVSFAVPRPGRLPLTRAYSIASPPADGGAISLLVNRVAQGGGSGYLFGLAPGDQTSLRGPLGSFTLAPESRDLLLVATGTGIAPFRSMLWALAETPVPRRVRLFWGLRSERDLYLQDELRQLTTLLPGFSFVTTLSQPSPAWTGARGRVGPLVEERIETVEGLDAYLCGNGGMIADVTAILRARGLCPIHTEQYYDDRRAATGTGRL